MAVTADECARELLDVIPPVMQALRGEVRKHRGSDLSIVQLRVLAFLDQEPGSPLSAVAEHVGLTLPSMSTHVTRLTARKLVERTVSDSDRRFVMLRLTERGKATLEEARNAARANVAKMLTSLSSAEQETLMSALQSLRRVFVPQPSSKLPNDLEMEP